MKKQLYLSLLDEATISEQQIQDFLEENTEYFPLPFLLGNYLHMNAVISKFPIDTSLITDFVYLTRHSLNCEIVMVELENPKKRIFKRNHRYNAYHSDFNNALAQINEWRNLLNSQPNILMDRLAPLIRHLPLSKSAYSFKYVLIYGRSSEFQNHSRRKMRLSNLNNETFQFLSYDSVLTWLERQQVTKPKNVLKLLGRKYTFKYLNQAPIDYFDIMTPDEFHIFESHKQLLEQIGYDMDAWYKGKLLKGGMHNPDSSDSRFFDASHWSEAQKKLSRILEADPSLSKSDGM